MISTQVHIGDKVILPETISAPSIPALRLLQYEAEIRRQKTEGELQFHLVNRTQKLIKCDLIILCQRSSKTANWNIVKISSLAQVNSNVLIVQALQDLLKSLYEQSQLNSKFATDILDIHNIWKPSDPSYLKTLREFPAHCLQWVPLRDRDNKTDAGIIFLRNEIFSPGEIMLLERICETYSHAWCAIPVKRTLGLMPSISSRVWVTSLVATGIAAAFPVRESIMAPVEVIAAEPAVITAPINGVIRKILVSPNEQVDSKSPLIQFEDIQARNESIQNQQKMAVAKARYEKLQVMAFNDPTAVHDLATAKAEYALSVIDNNYTKEILSRMVIKAPLKGVAIYSDRRDWEGRAVQVGEELLQIADPTRIAYRVEMNAANTLALSSGGDASIYLDSTPMGGYSAKINSVNYTPRFQSDGNTTYTVWLNAADSAKPRLGARGTARLYGETHPLIVQLLRRPWRALRQGIGL